MRAKNVIMIAVAGVLVFSVSACGGKRSPSEKITPETVATKDTGEPKVGAKKVFELAEQSVARRKYEQGLKYYEEVERLYPATDYASQAKLKSAWAAYKLGRHNDALDKLQRFAIRYPNSQYLDYNYWLTGLIYFERMPDPQRDQKNTLNALKYFKLVENNWPKSEYAKDARVKMDILIDQLAAKEMDIGRQYAKKKNYSAAINRFQYVVKEYETSSHTPEALYRQVEAYAALGLNDEAQRIAQVLGYNYSGSKWYDYAYKVVKGQKVKRIKIKKKTKKTKKTKE